MKLLKKLEQTVKAPVRRLVRAEIQRSHEDLLWLVGQLMDYHQSPPDRRQSHQDGTRAPLANLDYYRGLAVRLQEQGVAVENIRIDVDRFRAWLSEHRSIERAYLSSGASRIEKCLEHFFSDVMLTLHPGEVFIDVAAYDSPFAGVLATRGVDAYRLDLRYPPGIHGRDIGADAGDTHLPDAFADGLAAHCAYECFAGDADVRFLQEAARILRPGGRLLILPLYVDENYFILTSPLCNQREVPVDAGARRVWREDSHRMPFSRHYSPQAFAERIYRPLPSALCARVLFVENLADLMSVFPDQLIYCFFLLHVQKHQALTSGASQK